MNRNFLSLREIFNKEPALDNFRRYLKSADVVTEFYKIFPSLKKTVVPVKVEKKRIYLKVDNAALRSELKFNELTMVGKINKFFNEEVINSVRFL